MLLAPTSTPPSRASQYRSPTTSTPAYPTPTRSPLPKYEPPRMSFAKTEPWRLGFWFWAQIPPPSRAGRFPPASPSTPAYPAPNRFPLPNQEAPHNSFAKTEPRQLGFWFLPQIPPPSCIGRSPPPSPSTLAYPAPNLYSLSIDNIPRAQFTKDEPLWLNFGFLAQNLPSSCLTQFPPSRPSIPAYPAPNRSPLSIDDTPHAQFPKAKPLRLGFMFSLHFWSIAPIFTFSTIHQLVFAPVYILLHLHMYVHHQYTILGVQFRCVIS